MIYASDGVVELAVSEVRYVPDVRGMMAECEANYARLLKLVPEKGARKLAVIYPNGQLITIQFEVLESFRYTSTVRLSQCEAYCNWLTLPDMTIRLYHDARMAEVVDARHMRQLKGIYGYPNEQMLHTDEKVQRNMYLSEWLCYCLQHGHISEDVSLA